MVVKATSQSFYLFLFKNISDVKVSLNHKLNECEVMNDIKPLSACLLLFSNRPEVIHGYKSKERQTRMTLLL